jgi:hypothetical protein
MSAIEDDLEEGEIIDESDDNVDVEEDSEGNQSSIDYDDDEADDVKQLETEEIANHRSFVVDDEDDFTESDYEPNKEEEESDEDMELISDESDDSNEIPAIPGPSQDYKKEVRYKKAKEDGILKKVVTYYSMIATPKPIELEEKIQVIAIEEPTATVGPSNTTTTS